jgi:hypothetical protein
MLLQIAERKFKPDTSVMELTGKLALGRESQRIEALVVCATVGKAEAAV